MASIKGRAGVAAVILLLAVVIIAILALYPHQIEVSSEGDGTVSPMGDNEIRFYQGLDLDIRPDDRYTSKVYVDGVLVAEGVSDYRYSPSVLDFSPHTIEVVFVEYVPTVTQHSLTVTSEGNGTVSPSGTTSHDEGSVVRVVSTADDGNVIDDVLLDGVSVGPSNIVGVTMGSDHTVKVIFRPVGSGDIPVTVSVDVDVDIVVQTLGASQDLDYGYIVPSGTVYVEPHGSLTVSVVLNPGFEVMSMSVDGRSVGAVTEYTIEDITSSVSIQLSIVKKVNGFLIKASSGTGGSISPSGDVKVAEGDDSTFIFSPSSGYKVSYIVVDGVRTEYSGSSYTFTKVSASHTIEVAFTASGGGGSGGGSSGGGGSGGGGSIVTLTGIQITTPPTKTVYTEGEVFSTVGMVITATYSDGHTDVITTGYSYSPTGSLTTDDSVITISYSGKETTQSITVSPKTLVSIDATHYPTKVEYKAGESFVKDGMVITATYNNGDQKVVTGYSCSPTVFLEEGSFNVTITYTEGEVTKTCKVPVTVAFSDKVSVIVKGYSGTMVNDNGSVMSFSETPNNDLGLFRGFHLQNIVPGIKQTVTLEITNSSTYNLDLSLYVKTVDSSEKLSKQIQFSVGTADPKTLHDVLNGQYLQMGSLDAGDTKTISFVLEFLNLPENNTVMDESLGMTLGILSEAQT